jgi:hypothetical protein
MIIIKLRFLKRRLGRQFLAAILVPPLVITYSMDVLFIPCLKCSACLADILLRVVI